MAYPHLDLAPENFLRTIEIPPDARRDFKFDARSPVRNFYGAVFLNGTWSTEGGKNQGIAPQKVFAKGLPEVGKHDGDIATLHCEARAAWTLSRTAPQYTPRLHGIILRAQVKNGEVTDRQVGDTHHHFFIFDHWPTTLAERILMRDSAHVHDDEMALRARMLFKTACTLSHAHEHNIVHGDVKPENTVTHINSRATARELRGSYEWHAQQERVGICDFGNSYVAGHQFNPNALLGTVRFTPPEICSTPLTDERLWASKQRDEFSFGMTMLNALGGNEMMPVMPTVNDVPAIDDFEKFQAYVKQHRRSYIAGPPPIPDGSFNHRFKMGGANDIIHQCTAYNPDRRFGSMIQVAQAIANWYCDEIDANAWPYFETALAELTNDLPQKGSLLRPTTPQIMAGATNPYCSPNLTINSLRAAIEVALKRD